MINEPPAHDLLLFGKVPPALGVNLPLDFGLSQIPSLSEPLVEPPCDSLATLFNGKSGSILHLLNNKKMVSPCLMTTLGRTTPP